MKSSYPKVGSSTKHSMSGCGEGSRISAENQKEVTVRLRHGAGRALLLIYHQKGRGRQSRGQKTAPCYSEWGKTSARGRPWGGGESGPWTHEARPLVTIIVAVIYGAAPLGQALC